MCGQYRPPQDFREAAEIYRARFAAGQAASGKNVFPKYEGPVVGLFEGRREMRALLWGMLARSATSTDFLKSYSTFNAKSETIETSRIFSPAWNQGRRCIIPVEHFVEWEGEKGKKRRLLIHDPDEKLTSIAGLYDYTTNSAKIGSFTMLTVEPNEFMSKIHHRMPVVLTRVQAEDWLSADLAPDEAGKMLVPYRGKLELISAGA